MKEQKMHIKIHNIYIYIKIKKCNGTVLRPKGLLCHYIHSK